MKRLIPLFGAALLAALALMGCAGQRVVADEARIQESRERTAEAHARAAEATAKAEQSDAEIVKAACQRTDGPCVAAVMSAFIKRQSLAQSQPAMNAPVMARPPDLVDRGFQLLNLLLRGYEIDRGTEVAMHASDNAREMQLGAYGAIRDTAGEIQAPAANNTYTLTASGHGAAAGGGSGTYSAPSLSGPGVIGDGTYTANRQTQTTAGSYNPVSTTQGAP